MNEWINLPRSQFSLLLPSSQIDEFGKSSGVWNLELSAWSSPKEQTKAGERQPYKWLHRQGVGLFWPSYTSCLPEDIIFCNSCIVCYLPYFICLSLLWKHNTESFHSLQGHWRETFPQKFSKKNQLRASDWSKALKGFRSSCFPSRLDCCCQDTWSGWTLWSKQHCDSVGIWMA